MHDLVLLVPDKNTEHTVRGALERPKALQTRPVDFAVVVEQGRDGGVRKRGAQILRLQRNRFSHALLLLDYEGCGSEHAAQVLESELDAELAFSWSKNAKAIVIQPEMDVWMWGAETHIRDVVGWKHPVGIRDWLRSQSFEFDVEGKPARPKEALEAIFRKAQLPRSSASYESLARRVSLTRCKDQAFQRLRAAMTGWFPE